MSSKKIPKGRKSPEEEKEKHIWHQKLKKLEEKRFEELEELDDDKDTGDRL